MTECDVEITENTVGLSFRCLVEYGSGSPMKVLNYQFSGYGPSRFILFPSVSNQQTCWEQLAEHIVQDLPNSQIEFLEPGQWE